MDSVTHSSLSQFIGHGYLQHAAETQGMVACAIAYISSDRTGPLHHSIIYEFKPRLGAPAKGKESMVWNSGLPKGLDLVSIDKEIYKITGFVKSIDFQQAITKHRPCFTVDMLTFVDIIRVIFFPIS